MKRESPSVYEEEFFGLKVVQTAGIVSKNGGFKSRVGFTELYRTDCLLLDE